MKYIRYHVQEGSSFSEEAFKKEEDVWPMGLRPRRAKSKRTTSERPNAGTEDEEEDDDGESDRKRKRVKASSADFPDNIIGRGDENLPLSQLASFSSVLRSYGYEEKMSRQCEVYRVQGLKYSTAQLPICEFTYCKKPREKHELVVCGCYVDTQGVLDKTRGVMVLCAPVSADFEKPDIIEWVKVTSIKPLMPTGEEVHEDDVERIRLAADAEISRLLADDSETTKGDDELDESSANFTDDFFSFGPDPKSRVNSGRIRETPTRGQSVDRVKPGASWLGGRGSGGSGNKKTATGGGGQQIEEKKIESQTDRMVQLNSLAIQEILARLRKTQPTSGPPVQSKSAFSSELPLPIPFAHRHTEALPMSDKLGRVAPMDFTYPDVQWRGSRCCSSHKSRCAACHEAYGSHICDKHHASLGHDRSHRFMSESDRLRDAHSKAVLIIKQYEAREMARVNARWGYHSNLHY